MSLRTLKTCDKKYMFGTFILDLALEPLLYGHKELVEAWSNAAATSEADTGLA